MVDEKLRVLAERLVDKLLRTLGKTAHRGDAVTLEPACRAACYLPEICYGSVIPQRFSEKLLVKISHVVLAVLCGDVEGDLGKKKICADTGGGGDVHGLGNLVHQLLCKRPAVRAVGAQVVSRVDKSLVDGVDMDILRCKIFKINCVNVGSVFDVKLHTRRCDLVFDRFRYFVNPASVTHSLRLELRRYRKAYRAAAAGYIRHDEVSFKGV